MKNKCKDCGKCCLDTEMILSRRDINTIIRNSKTNIKEKDFIFLNNSKHYQLKNHKGYCVFFESSLRECMIYEYRPRGCRFYPLIFDLMENKCKLDEECPRKSLFYENKDSFKETCKEIKRYLEEELSIEIIN